MGATRAASRLVSFLASQKHRKIAIFGFNGRSVAVVWAGNNGGLVRVDRNLCERRKKVVTWVLSSGRIRAAALVAAMAVVFLPTAWALGQHRRGGRAQAHSSAQQSRPQNRAQDHARPERQSQGDERGKQDREQENAGPRPYGPPSGAPPAFPRNGFRPAYPGPMNNRPLFPGPPIPPYYNPRYAPPGHLEDWLNRHRDLPLREQEQILRNDPSFSRLPPANQQRLLRQLQEVDRLSPQRRALRLARAEAIEHLSPQARRQLDMSSLRFASLPPQRQALMKRAFQQLRSVPLDERPTVLNSARYRDIFTPEERQILSNFLSVEPYLPPRQGH